MFTEHVNTIRGMRGSDDGTLIATAYVHYSSVCCLRWMVTVIVIVLLAACCAAHILSVVCCSTHTHVCRSCYDRKARIYDLVAGQLIEQ